MENATSAFSQTPSTPRGGIIIPSTSVYTRLYAQIEERNLYIVQQGVRKASISQTIFNLVLFFFNVLTPLALVTGRGERNNNGLYAVLH